MHCGIWYHLYNLKNVKNIHGTVLVLVKFVFFIFKTLSGQHHGKNDMDFSSLKSPKFINFGLCENQLNSLKPHFKAALAKILANLEIKILANLEIIYASYWRKKIIFDVF